MKSTLPLILGLAVAACGGNKKPQGPPPPDPMLNEDDEGLAEDSEPVAEPEPEPIPPQEWFARAALSPVKGSKMKPRVVMFSQTEGEGSDVSADAPFEGLKPGKYHLVVHESADCGKNAAKVGAAWAKTSGVKLYLDVEKGAPASLDEGGVGLMLDGDESIVGRTLVLHEDKKGKLGKALACGAITAEGGDDEAED